MLVLKFDYELLANDLCEYLLIGADEAINHFMSDAKAHLKANDFEAEEAIFDMAKSRITAQCVFYAHSILESYGRGSKMDMENEYLSEYIGNKSLGWNPLRTGTTIVGRPKGEYTDFFGNKAFSTGSKAGQNMEIKFNPTKPSYAIQNAEKKLNKGLSENGYVLKILKRYADDFFDNLNASKYFYYKELKQ